MVHRFNNLGLWLNLQMKSEMCTDRVLKDSAFCNDSNLGTGWKEAKKKISLFFFLTQLQGLSTKILHVVLSQSAIMAIYNLARCLKHLLNGVKRVPISPE